MTSLAAESREINDSIIPTTDAPLLLSRRDAARSLAISVRTLDELLATRQLPSLKIGKRRLISQMQILRFIHKAEARS